MRAARGTHVHSLRYRSMAESKLFLFEHYQSFHFTQTIIWFVGGVEKSFCAVWCDAFNWLHCNVSTGCTASIRTAASLWQLQEESRKLKRKWKEQLNVTETLWTTVCFSLIKITTWLELHQAVCRGFKQIYWCLCFKVEGFFGIYFSQYSLKPQRGIQPLSTPKN